MKDVKDAAASAIKFIEKTLDIFINSGQKGEIGEIQISS